ncbi:hypothetical protein JYU34_021841 [Plutella xylostella]|uniref:Reverse transcriptase domain-containing protein n=1 Tax=Plutella xylostella TaxID=51655 RepID=A0ABQ7PRH4_PLUXY|nr:hypothetical protein JYU34_021841 [Plutella xylostella]
MLSGSVCEDITEILYGANLVALIKKDGGIRPIAVGNTIRRTASKICCRKMLPELSKKFEPIQLGFGTKGGCEAAVHAARTFITKGDFPVLLKVDVKNAFNSINRSALLTEIRSHANPIYKYIWQCYSKPSKLSYKNHHILSATGCQQGDPLGPAIFSLGIHPHISNLNSKFNVWYLDDGTLGGDASTVLQDLNSIIQNFSTIGLELNFGKCELHLNESLSDTEKYDIINKFNVLAPNIKIVKRDGLRLLGAPILDESIPGYVQDQINKFEDSYTRMCDINPHMAMHIMKYCLFVPKLTYEYVLRCSNLWKFPLYLSHIDEVIKCSITEILNCRMDDRGWTQATLPVRYGGIGIRKASDVALPAFLSSVYSTRDLFGRIITPSLGDLEVPCLTEAKIAWLNAAGPGQDIPTDTTSQRLWDAPLCAKKEKQLLETATDAADRARLLASSTPQSGYWLNAYPSANLGTLLDRTTLTVAISLRLGLQTNEPHRCRCGEHADRRGHHGLSCGRSAGRIARHAALNDTIRRALASANVPATLEPSGIMRDDGKRPDGMSLVPWKRGRLLVWDATCVDTLAPSHLPSTSREAGAAAGRAEMMKGRKYASLGEGYMFVPFGVETLGPWGPEARQLFKDISIRLIEVSRDPSAGSYLAQRLSIAIQRGNAASVLGTLPDSGSDLASIFFLV